MLVKNGFARSLLAVLDKKGKAAKALRRLGLLCALSPALFGCSPDVTPDEQTATVVDAGASSDGSSTATAAGLKVFDDTRLHTIELSLSSSDWQTLIAEAAQSQGYGDVHPYVRARVSFNDVELDADVGLRLKGHLSLQLAEGHSFPLKLDFNRFQKGLTLDGLKKLNLHTEFDGRTAIVRDYLSYEAWRQFGVAASRTSFARVKVNQEDLGVYVLVEQVDGDFLARHFDKPLGDLYKPEQISGSLEYCGANISAYPDIGHKWPDQSDHTSLLHALKVLDSGSLSEVAQVFDVSGVLTYLAGNVALGSRDFYPTTAHNYYLYEKSPGLFTFLPWDMNGSQDNDTHVCSAAQGHLTGRLLEEPTYEELYFDTLSDFLAGPGSSTWQVQRLNAAAKLLGSVVSDEQIAALHEQILQRCGRLQTELTATATCHGSN